MTFSEPIFLFFFFPITYIIYRLLPSLTWKNAWLAVASLVFFSFGQLPYVLLLLASVFINFLFGLWLQSGLPRKKLAIALAVLMNLGLMCTFKYLDFLLSSWNYITGSSLPLPGIVLPIGISFYTFQGLSYIIDIYRDPGSGTHSFWKLLLYIAFFPQLIAGPIVIYHDISRQIEQRRLLPELTLSGLERFIGGLGKKLLLADTMAVVADGIFNMDGSTLDARLAWLGAICYTLQIYFDFSGYSDMAIGLGRMFGFQFLENFNLPYTARSIKEFWRRWHISLSSWFKNYLYIPLGGNRKGQARTALNRFLVFFTTGLWHGANWTFVLWGLWHGLFSVLENAGVIPKRLCRSPLGHLYTMLVVVLGFTLFRADTLSSALSMFSAMFTGFTFRPEGTLALIALLDVRTVFMLIVAILFAAGLPQRLVARLEQGAFALQTAQVKTALYVVLFCVSLLTVVSTTFSPFIYFQF